jgi:glycine/D-amino acid oxidase-like deaminating enzyme
MTTQADAQAALAASKPVPYWLDQPGAPPASPALAEGTRADLAVIGGGFTGLWTALLARERHPDADIVLLEARTVGWAASGRNGGFCSASLTHGLGNGLARFPDEIGTLVRLGQANLDEIAATIDAHGIDCGFERTGELVVATAPWQLAGLAEDVAASRRCGEEVVLLNGEAIRAELNSPTYLGGTWHPRSCAMLDPARLAWGLRRACAESGVRIYENTPVRSITSEGHAGLRLATPHGVVHAARVALGTGCFSPLLRRLRRYLVPAYDYALVTEPLSGPQLASIGWQNRQGVADAANQFHYYRITGDNRILWGGYDAVYYNGGRIRPEQNQSPATFALLAEHFFEAFPQLAGLRFTHAWGGVIDTCSRFCAFYGLAHGKRLAYAAGYTGLGVGATRFGANVILDLLDGEPTERTSLQLVRTKPVPFPPEPLRSGVIQMTRASIAKADRNEGRRDMWLRTLDRLGLGFDS